MSQPATSHRLLTRSTCGRARPPRTQPASGAPRNRWRRPLAPAHHPAEGVRPASPRGLPRDAEPALRRAARRVAPPDDEVLLHAVAAGSARARLGRLRPAAAAGRTMFSSLCVVQRRGRPPRKPKLHRPRQPSTSHRGLATSSWRARTRAAGRSAPAPRARRARPRGKMRGGAGIPFRQPCARGRISAARPAARRWGACCSRAPRIWGSACPPARPLRAALSARRVAWDGTERVADAGAPGGGHHSMRLVRLAKSRPLALVAEGRRLRAPRRLAVAQTDCDLEGAPATSEWVSLPVSVAG